MVTILATAALVATTSCRDQSAPAIPPPLVVVAEVTTTNATLSTEFIGQLDSPQNVEVRARVEAFVDQVLFKEGTEVQEGDPLFLLDTKPFQARLEAAEGQLAEAKASLEKCDKDVGRLAPLADKHAIPRQDLENAVAAVAVARAGLQSAEARVASAKLDLSYCEVKAPIKGLIGAKQVSVGTLVGRGQPTLLATISQLDPIWFYCNVSEVDYLRAGRRAQESGRKLEDIPAALVLADGSDYPEPGKWLFVDRAVDTGTATLRIRAEFRNPQRLLRPGMFARARVSLRSDKPTVLVPQRAVQEMQGRSFVWVVGEGNKVSQRLIQTGETVGGGILVQDGLKAGDRLVVEGLQKVREGAPVHPLTAAEMAKAAAAQAGPSSTPGKE